MKIVFLPSAKPSVRWFNAYYGQVFPEGSANARKSMANAKRMLIAYPMSGTQIEGRRARLFQISKTPFAVIYRIGSDRIEILALHDSRSEHMPGL